MNYLSRVLTIISFLMLLLTCGGLVYGQELNSVREINKEGLSKILRSKEANKLVVNFWASWCKPCIVEMPWMDKLSSVYKKDSIKVYFISLDDDVFARKTMPKILKRLNLQSPVYRLIYDGYSELESAVKMVNEQWDGAIPATTVIDRKTKQERFLEGGLTQDELIKELESM